MSNDRLPPGCSTADIDRAFDSSTHEHEWRQCGEELLENGAAFIDQKCHHREVLDSTTGPRGETYYEEGPECGQKRTIRFEPTVIRVQGGMEHEVPPMHEEPEGEYQELLVNFLWKMEQLWYDNEAEIQDVNPDPDDGLITIEGDGLFVKYEADTVKTI